MKYQAYIADPYIAICLKRVEIYRLEIHVGRAKNINFEGSKRSNVAITLTLINQDPTCDNLHRAAIERHVVVMYCGSEGCDCYLYLQGNYITTMSSCYIIFLQAPVLRHSYKNMIGYIQVKYISGIFTLKVLTIRT